MLISDRKGADSKPANKWLHFFPTAQAQNLGVNMYNDKDSDKIWIAEMGGEGGGASVYALQIGNALVFWRESASVDEDDIDNPWTYSYSKPVTELDEALPPWWARVYPVYIDPLFIPWFRDRYEQYDNDALTSSEEDSGHYERDSWLAILYAGRKTSLKKTMSLLLVAVAMMANFIPYLSDLDKNEC
jgi:hypothetical protein